MRPLLAMLVFLAPVLASAPAAADDRTVILRDGQLLLAADAGPAPGTDAVIGIEFPVGGPGGGGYLARIRGVMDDPHAAVDPITLYDVEFLDRRTGQWEALCNPGPFGLALAVPVAGNWSRDGRFLPRDDGRFTFSCTSGAHVKCLRMGYAPWMIGPDGESLAPYHQACTRMMRADYCGIGQPFTVAGRTIQIIDRRNASAGGAIERLEAIWGEHGAICVRRPRVPDQFPLKQIHAACPRLADVPAAMCTNDLLKTHPGALLLNQS